MTFKCMTMEESNAFGCYYLKVGEIRYIHLKTTLLGLSMIPLIRLTLIVVVRMQKL